MSVDFSFFKNPENLIFLFIVLLVAVALLFIIFFVISIIFKFLKKIFLALFASKAKPKQEKPVLDTDKAEPVNAPIQRVMGGNFTRSVSPAKDNPENKNQDAVKVDREKEMASAVKGLEALKSSHSPDNEQPKSSKFPSIGGRNQETEDNFKKIKIPRRKKFESDGKTEGKELAQKETGGGAVANLDAVQVSDKGNNQQKNNIIFKKISPIIDKIIVPKKKDKKEGTEGKEKELGAKESDLSSISAKGIDAYRFDVEEDLKVKPETKDISLYEKPDILNNDLKWTSKSTEKMREEFKKERSEKTGESDHKNFISKKTEDPFFGSKTEISRSEIREKLRNDPKIWRAQKEAGLSLSPLERVKLEKEVFSQALGGNISREDLRSGIRKLNQKMFNSKNISEKAKIRKEINFFKKIGGIK